MTEKIDEYFTATVRALPAGRGGSPLTGSLLSTADVLGLFDSQLGSRHLDLAARWLRGRGKGFYTIGSSGHEGNAAVAAALRPTDPALLHYRSGGFFLQRARQVDGSNPCATCCSGYVPRPTIRSAAAGTRSSVATTSP